MFAQTEGVCQPRPAHPERNGPKIYFIMPAISSLVLLKVSSC